MLTVREINNIKMGAKKTPTTLPTATKQQTNSTFTNAAKTAKKSAMKSKDNAATVAGVVDSKSSSINAKDATKKSDNSNKVTITATSNKKVPSKPVANSNEKIVVAKKPQIIGDPKNNKSRDNSIDNSNKKQGVNSKSKNTDIAEQAKSPSNSHAAVVGENKKIEMNLNQEKCNKTEKSSPVKSSLENSMKKCTEKESDKIKPIASEKHSTNFNNPKKVNSSIINKRSADKPKSSKTINVIKKTNKGRESKIKISNELKNLAIDGVQKEISSGLKTSICEMVKLKKARHNNPNDKSNITGKNNKVKEPQNKSFITKIIESSNPKNELKGDTRTSDQNILNGAKEIKKIITASKTNNELIEKRKYVKKNDKILESKDNDIKSQEQSLAEEPKIDIKKKSEIISSPPPSTTKKLKAQVEGKIIGIKANNKIISATDQKEKQKKENARNQSSTMPTKGSNEETRASNAKSNETKIVLNNKTRMTAKIKSKLEQAVDTKIIVPISKKSQASVTKAFKNKVMEKDPLKISSSSSENENSSEDERKSVIKKPTKPRVKQAMKVVSRITSIKKCRVASLNAIAKVHCLYENEARVQHLDHSSSFTKVVKKPTVVSVCNVSSDDDDDDDDDEIKECISKR